MERNEALPQFFKLPLSRLMLELHMDDFPGSGRKSEVIPFPEKVRGVLKLKTSECIITAKYEHLKRTRIKMTSGTVIQPREKHARNIIEALGLQNANPAKTPDLDEDEPEYSPPVSLEKHGVCRQCTGHGIYMGIDRYDCQRTIGLLG